jgi:hypothetical protein
VSTDIKLDDSYEKFLKKNNSSVSLNVSLSFENDDYSHLSVKSNMNDIKNMLSQIYCKYQDIARVDASNFAKLGRQFKELDEEIARDLNNSN